MERGGSAAILVRRAAELQPWRLLPAPEPVRSDLHPVERLDRGDGDRQSSGRQLLHRSLRHTDRRRAQLLLLRQPLHPHLLGRLWRTLLAGDQHPAGDRGPSLHRRPEDLRRPAGHPAHQWRWLPVVVDPARQVRRNHRTAECGLATEAELHRRDPGLRLLFTRLQSRRLQRAEHCRRRSSLCAGIRQRLRGGDEEHPARQDHDAEPDRLLLRLHRLSDFTGDRAQRGHLQRQRQDLRRGA